MRSLVMLSQSFGEEKNKETDWRARVRESLRSAADSRILLSVRQTSREWSKEWSKKHFWFHLTKGSLMSFGPTPKLVGQGPCA